MASSARKDAAVKAAVMHFMLSRLSSPAALPSRGAGERSRESPQLAWAARCGPAYSSNTLNVHTLPPAGTLARLGSPARITYGPVAPLVTVTNCLPSFSQVTGCPTIPAEVWNSHRILPVSESTAITSPVRRPVNTSPPAVTSVPAKFGLLNGTAHLDLPVSGSTARR